MSIALSDNYLSANYNPNRCAGCGMANFEKSFVDDSVCEYCIRTTYVCTMCKKRNHIRCHPSVTIDNVKYCGPCYGSMENKAIEEYENRKDIQLPTLYRIIGSPTHSDQLFICLLCQEIHNVQTHPYVCTTCNDRLPAKKEEDASADQKVNESWDGKDLLAFWEHEEAEAKGHYEAQSHNLKPGMWYCFLSNGDWYEDVSEEGVIDQNEDGDPCYVVHHSINITPSLKLRDDNKRMVAPLDYALRCSGQCRRHFCITDLTARQIWSNPVQIRLYCDDCSICYFGSACRKGKRCPFVHL